jgi:hypothetical protein
MEKQFQESGLMLVFKWLIGLPVQDRLISRIDVSIAALLLVVGIGGTIWGIAKVFEDGPAYKKMLSQLDTPKWEDTKPVDGGVDDWVDVTNEKPQRKTGTKKGKKQKDFLTDAEMEELQRLEKEEAAYQEKKKGTWRDTIRPAPTVSNNPSYRYWVAATLFAGLLWFLPLVLYRALFTWIKWLFKF